MENRIDATLTNADRDNVLQAILDIRASLPFLIDLTTEDRRSLPKMGDKSRAFVTQALVLAEQNDDFLPRSFDVAEMRKDVDLVDQMLPIVTALSQLNELVDDTFTLAGSDAYSAALIVYNSAKSNGAGEALDSLVDTLGQRFARKAKATPTT